jgi:hypothetical protein
MQSANAARSGWWAQCLAGMGMMERKSISVITDHMPASPDLLQLRVVLRPRFVLSLLLVALLASCGSTTPPPPAPVELTAPSAAPAPEPPPLGVLRVTASTLNVRREPTTTADIVSQTKRGDHLTIVSVGNDWMQVELANGNRGWVSAQYVTRDQAEPPSSTTRGTHRAAGCAPDSDYRFVKTPTPVFSDSGAHGLVVVEGNVDKYGKVLSTHVVSNTTGDDALAFMAERELKNATFEAPVRNCVARAFIFTYTRTF